ncbi:hypothetical protein [Pedococcus bigeumensis]|uniref:Uncharacterized protein n=1 Tax=Pedococcus bigeumensis TaxID=433644 RepID=A0A502CTV4_9MICO|nr:hypothetical protein [Pedococcus bigeumensis]TPG17055.1 hypothetical protein EAH86_09775 [Pedococcus bigeumensis]
MTILVTEPPVGTIPHLSVAGRFHIDNGSLAVNLPPDVRRIGIIALTILETMGKDLRVTGGNAVRNEEHIKYAPIWVAAHGLDRIAVLNGQRVTAAMAGHLRTLFGQHAQIIAVCESGTSRRTLRLLKRDGAAATTLDWDDFLTSNPVRQQQAPTEAPTDGYTLDDLPHVDFLVFRHTAQTITTPAMFATIDKDYTTAFKAATQIEPNLETVLDDIARITWNAHSTASILVTVKAFQAALFRRGWLLRARADQLLGTLCSVRHPRATDRDWKALRAYIRPERSATAALFLLNVPAADIPTLTLKEVENALTDGALRGAPIPEAARPLLIAEALRRHAENQSPDGPFLTLPPGNPRRHLEFIIDARRDLGLPIDGRTIRTENDTHRTRTLYNLGLDLGSLT